MSKVSVKSAARDAAKAEVVELFSGVSDDKTRVVSRDSFQNFQQKLGIGTDNPSSYTQYGFNPISRRHIQLEWMHRGSWIAGRVVDTVADDMTRAGVTFKGEIEPADIETLNSQAQEMGIWTGANETIKWGRLYGGCLGVMLIDGQNMKTPFKLETVGKDQFKGLLVLDRWMVEPVVEDLVTDLGPNLGLPKFYRVQANAPALRGQVIHHSRVAFRHEGVRLPYNQRLTENLWGISVIERLFDRMVAFDAASTGISQLIYKAYLRTFKVKGLREIIANGAQPQGAGPLNGLLAQMEMMRRYQGQEGITLMDLEDEFEVQEAGAFSGLDKALDGLASQLSGATEIPLTRLFGQSPGGMNATGESDMQNYFDLISQKQNRDLKNGLILVFRCIGQSNGIKLGDDFGVDFNSLERMSDKDKAEIAKTITDTILSGKDAGVIPDKVILQELRQLAHLCGVWSNITTDMIEEADEEVMPEMGTDPATGLPMATPHPDDAPFDPKPAQEKVKFERTQTAALNKAKTKPAAKKKVADGKVTSITIRPQGTKKRVA